MQTTIRNEDGMSCPFYKTSVVEIEHPSGLKLMITETPEGLKVVETGGNANTVSIKPSSANSFIIQLSP